MRGQLAQRFPVTLHLAIVSLAIALAIAVPAGVLAATHKGGPIDHACRILALIGVSVPAFWQRLLVSRLFAVIPVGPVTQFVVLLTLTTAVSLACAALEKRVTRMLR